MPKTVRASESKENADENGGLGLDNAGRYTKEIHQSELESRRGTSRE
jgi:hypothetical protein